jgi:hypothetical protein
MAEKPYTVLVDKFRNKVVKWENMTNGDTGEWYPNAGHYPDKTAHAFGTNGTGLHVYIQGTNEPANANNAVNLVDATEDAINITALPDIKVVLPNTVMVRPAVAGDANTNVTVIMEMLA